MATYKVIQDIEAEDKFLGPLTLKQFIFGAIAGFFGYLSFFAVSRGAVFLLPVFMPPVFLGAFLAIPWSKDQSTEVWVLAKLRFKFKSKSRVWDQAGLEELVTITVPKKVEKNLTNGLDPTEVRSRLKALAETIDSRGWAVKNATFGEGYMLAQPADSERLLDPALIPKAVPELDAKQYDDVMADDNAVGSNLNYMMQNATDQLKQQSLEKMERIRNGEPLEAIQEPEVNFTPPSEMYGNRELGTAQDDKALSRMLREKTSTSSAPYGHLKTVQVYPGAGSLAKQPVSHDQAGLKGVNKPAEQSSTQPQAKMTKTVDPGILRMSQDNNRYVSTLARDAKKNDPEDNEVVIPLR